MASLLPLLKAADPADFKLAIVTDEVSNEWDVVLDFFKRFNLRYAEIRNVEGHYNTAQPLPLIREARLTLDQARIRTAALATGFFKIRLPQDNAQGQTILDKQWDLLDGAMQRARILGTNTIRTFAFVHPRGEQPDKSHYPRIAELLKEAARRAGERGFRLAIENVGDSYVARAEQSAWVLKAVQDPALGLTWDPNNAAASGDRLPYPEGYNMLDPARILHVHLRDYRRTADGDTEWCGIGDGEFDHGGQIRALMRDGYRGALSIETHFQLDGSKLKASQFSAKGLLEKIRQI